MALATKVYENIQKENANTENNADDVEEKKDKKKKKDDDVTEAEYEEK